MTDVQIRALGLSAAVHTVVLACVLAAGSFAPRSRTIMLDLAIGGSAQPKQGTRRMTTAARLPAPERTERRMVTPLQDGPEAVPVQADRAAKDRPPVDRVSEQADPGSSEGVSEAQQGYINAHFARIRDRIMKRLSYPPLARIRGWTGKVIVSFIVGEDGQAEEIRIVQPSGHDVLDRNAVETIRRSCPLPRPPVRVALSMPIVYQLH